ncbi:MAG: nucleotide exchange factor GrpE [Thiotrichales bacterium]|nr:nucleotide exchange factor GrpE [Thiotrichales bacterium]
MSGEQHRQEDETADPPVEGSEAGRAAADPERNGAASLDGAGAADGTDTSGPSGAADSADAGRETEAGEAGLEAESPEPATASIEDELTEARHEARQNLERALRAHAELDNVRKRLERDLQNAHKFALERFVSELLPVKDSLELGLAAAAGKGTDAAGIVEGMELTLRMLDQAMEKFGVRTVDPVGMPFDPEFHQAMTMRESDTAEPGTVLEVVQKGCLLNERLVRPAMVIVAKQTRDRG